MVGLARRLQSLVDAAQCIRKSPLVCSHTSNDDPGSWLEKQDRIIERLGLYKPKVDYIKQSFAELNAMVISLKLHVLRSLN